MSDELTIPEPRPEVAAVFPDSQTHWWQDSGPEAVRNHIFAALRPFARMHREGSDPAELACQRGVASSATCLTSADFERAFELLLELGDGEFAELVSGDKRYDPTAT